MKHKKTTIISTALITICLCLCLSLLGKVKATTFDATMGWNGTSNFTIGIISGNVINVQHFEADGVGYVRLTFDDGNSEVMTLENYIAQHETQWSQTGDNGFTWNELVHFTENAINWILGKEKNPTVDEQGFALQLTRGFVTRQEYYNLLLQNQQLNLRVEALERTVSQKESEAYCQAKIDMLQEYDLSTVSCENTTYFNHIFEGQIFGITPM